MNVYYTIKRSFIEQINNAKYLDELERIYENITDIITDIIKDETGYKYAKDVPKSEWDSYSKKRIEIYNKFVKDGVDLNP